MAQMAKRYEHEVAGTAAVVQATLDASVRDQDGNPVPVDPIKLAALLDASPYWHRTPLAEQDDSDAEYERQRQHCSAYLGSQADKLAEAEQRADDWQSRYNALAQRVAELEGRLNTAGPDCLCSEHHAGDVDYCPACYKQDEREDAVTVKRDDVAAIRTVADELTKWADRVDPKGDAS